MFTFSRREILVGNCPRKRSDGFSQEELEHVLTHFHEEITIDSFKRYWEGMCLGDPENPSRGVYILADVINVIRTMENAIINHGIQEL